MIYFHSWFAIALWLLIFVFALVLSPIAQASPIPLSIILITVWLCITWTSCLRQVQVFPIGILVLGLALLPTVMASPIIKAPFPTLTFKVFSNFITQHFSSTIPLSTVLVILFSLTENPDLLSLHARQQYIKTPGENTVTASGWIKALARALKKDIGWNQKKPLKMKGIIKDVTKDEQITAFSIKLDALSQILGLYSCDD